VDAQIAYNPKTKEVDKTLRLGYISQYWWLNTVLYTKQKKFILSNSSQVPDRKYVVPAVESKVGKEIMSLLLNLNKESGTTLIIVTHDPTVAEHTQRVIRLQDGQLESVS
jgi:hypothetical protein